MITPIALAALMLRTATVQPSDAPQYRGQGQMRIFDMLCNHVFPDDARIEAAMARVPGVRPLAADELRAYLKDDPGRGWTVPAGSSRIVVTLEAAPVHACAIRMTDTDGVIDERVWKGLIGAAQVRAGGGFTELPARSFDLGQVRSDVSGVEKRSRDGSMEAFYLIRTSSIDPSKPHRNDVEIRMLRQLVSLTAR